jgi:excisionase family DNA binding protein
MPLPPPKPNTPGHQIHDAPLLDIRAVARRLGVADKTVRRFIDRGELRAFRIGRLLRISEEEYLRFLAARI